MSDLPEYSIDENENLYDQYTKLKKQTPYEKWNDFHKKFSEALGIKNLEYFIKEANGINQIITDNQYNFTFFTYFDIGSLLTKGFTLFNTNVMNLIREKYKSFPDGVKIAFVTNLIKNKKFLSFQDFFSYVYSNSYLTLTEKNLDFRNFIELKIIEILEETNDYNFNIQSYTSSFIYFTGTESFKLKIVEIINCINFKNFNLNLTMFLIDGFGIDFKKIILSKDNINEIAKKNSKMAASGILGLENQKNAIEKFPYYLSEVKNQTDELCLIAVKSDPNTLQHVKNQTDKLCLIAIKFDPNTLRFVKNQTDELCLVAIKSDPNTLRFVKNQTYELCLVAIKSDPNTLRFVTNQTDELCLIAITSDPNVLQYVKNQTEEICLTAVNINPFSFKYIQNQYVLHLKEILNEQFIRQLFRCGLSFEFLIEKYLGRKYNDLIKLEQEKALHETEKLTKLADWFFSLYVNYVFEKEENNGIKNFEDKIIKLDNTVDYYHSFISQTNLNPIDVFQSDKFIWFSSQFDQSFLHLFNVRKINKLAGQQINLCLAKFKLQGEIKVINSENIHNNNIFLYLLKPYVNKAIVDALKIRHEFVIKLTNLHNSYYANGEFSNENNKFILIILNELNKFIVEPENKIYGYYNKLDQNEVALIQRTNLINPDSVKISKYTRFIREEPKGTITFPTVYDNYLNYFSDIVVTYITGDKLITNLDHIKCIKNKGYNLNAYRMYQLKSNTQIYYQDFDNDSVELEFKPPETEDYWKQKYLKYKQKYIALKAIKKSS